MRVFSLAILAFFLNLQDAEAARCPKGQIYRPSSGKCSTIAQAISQGVKIKQAPSTLQRKRTRRPDTSWSVYIFETPYGRVQPLQPPDANLRNLQRALDAKIGR